VHATWKDFVSEVVDFREAGDEQAVAIHHLTGRARESGVPLDTRIALVLTWRHDKLWRAVSYKDLHEGLEAVGLRE
jgi:ketosteroid isomerase-like protein